MCTYFERPSELQVLKMKIGCFTFRPFVAFEIVKGQIQNLRGPSLACDPLACCEKPQKHALMYFQIMTKCFEPKNMLKLIKTIHNKLPLDIFYFSFLLPDIF